MINNDYENYGKPFHYLLSPSIWLDLDSFVYIVVVALIVFGVVKIVAKFKKSKKKVKIIDFFFKVHACLFYPGVSSVFYSVVHLRSMDYE